MGKSSIWHFLGLMSKRRSASFVAALLCSSCAAPDAPSERAAVTTSAIAVATTPVLSAEFDLDHSAVLERARACPLAAFGTTSYLVTHSDFRAWTVGFTRFDRGGQSLGAFDIPGAQLNYTDGVGDRCAPVVFRNGVFVTYWAGVDGTLWCTRIAEDGSLLNGVGVSTGISSSAVESVALGADSVLASMSNGRVALVGTDCSAITAPVALPATAGTKRWPAGSAFDGTQYWVAYSETVNSAADRFFLQAVSAAGVPTGSPITVGTAPWVRSASSSYYLPAVQGSVGAGGGKTVVAYGVQLYSTPFPPAPGAKTVDLRYAELSGAGVLSNDASLTPAFANPRIAFARDGFVLVSGAGGYGIQKRLNDGSALSGGFSAFGDMTSLAVDGDNVLIATTGYPSGNIKSSYAKLVGPDLQLLADSALQHMSDRHEVPVIARATQSSLVVWKQSYNRLLGSRLATDGTILDPQSLAIHQPETVDGPLVPVVASNGTDFLVLWSGSIAGSGYAVSITAERVSGDGEVGRSREVAHGSTASGLRPAGFEPVVASNGSEYLVVWGHGDTVFHDPGSTALYSIEAARVSSTGQLLDYPPLVLRTFSAENPFGVYSQFGGGLGVTYDGEQYVVVWNIGLPDDTSNDGDPFPETPDAPIVVQRVSDTGQIGSPIQTPWRSSLNSPPPTISWGDSQGLVVFAHGPRILAGLVNRDPLALDEPAVLLTGHRASGNDARSSVAWDGTNYWVSWKDSRRVTHDDVYLTRVSTDGVVLEPTGIPLSLGDSGPENGTSGAQLVSTPGRVLAAYTRFGLEPEVFNYVLHGRWLSSALAQGGQGGQGGTPGGSAGATYGGGGQSSTPAGSGGVSGSSAPSDSGGASGGGVVTSGGSTSSSGGTTSSNGGDTSSSGGTTSSNGGDTSSSGGSTSSSGGSTSSNGGSTSSNGGSTSSNGGSTSSNGGSNSPSGGGGEPPDSGSPSSDAGGPSPDAGSPSSDAGRSGGTVAGAGAAAAPSSGGAPGSTPHHFGCSLGAAPGSTKPSLLWLITLALALVHRRRLRRVARFLTPLPD